MSPKKSYFIIIIIILLKLFTIKTYFQPLSIINRSSAYSCRHILQMLSYNIYLHFYFWYVNNSIKVILCYIIEQYSYQLKSFSIHPSSPLMFSTYFSTFTYGTYVQHKYKIYLWNFLMNIIWDICMNSFYDYIKTS